MVDGFETGGNPGIPQAIKAVLEAAGSGDVGVEYQPGIRCTPHSNSICSDPASDPQLLADAVHAAQTASQVVIVSAVPTTLTVGAVTLATSLSLVIAETGAEPAISRALRQPGGREGWWRVCVTSKVPQSPRQLGW